MDGRTAKRWLGQSRRGMLIRILLMCALAGVLLAVGASYASYSSSDGAEDGARVAGGLVKVEYNETVKDTDNPIDGNPNITLVRPSDDGVKMESFDFSVSSGDGIPSEVAIKYDINVTLQEPDTLPDGVTIELMSEGKVLGLFSGSGNDGALAASGVFEPGKAEKHKYTIVFKGDFSKVPSTTDYQKDVSITVKAEQVD